MSARFSDWFGGVFQRKAAQRNRYAAPDVAAAHVNEFKRSAAEIASDTVGLIDSGDDAERGQFGFAPSGQNVDFDATDTLGLRDECGPVFGIPAGRGGDAEHTPDLEVVAQRTEAPQRHQGLGHGVGCQQPGGLNLPSEPGQHLLIENRRRAAGLALIDHQAHRIGADIDHGDRGSVIEAALRRLWRQRHLGL